ncbi:MAG: hypothetical protein P1P83_10600 [Bacteroidales bacterium]|nr:hypothetical protein [Bacteroidales bacterium]MDT8374873.1 hypothetical protein [Bacteroidales bacterium]
MSKTVASLLLIMLLISCNERGRQLKRETASEPAGAAYPELTVTDSLPPDAILIAGDIVTEVIIKPDPDGDPWETEKVAGYRGADFISSIFMRIYDGTMTVYDYHTGEALSADDVKKIEHEFGDDRSVIGKLSFTEDWYYFPSSNSLHKRAKSVTFGYELYNNLGKVYAYRAAFRADLH